MSFKPMLAADCKGDTSLLRFPLLASPKLDGIRCIIMNGTALSRSLKPIPNAFIQKWAALHADQLEGLDGELIVGSPTGEGVMQRAMSGCMSKDGEPDFTFHVFDRLDDLTFADRRASTIYCKDIPRCTPVYHVLVLNASTLDTFEASMLASGYEGIMTRSPEGSYKQGRSTLKEQGLVKVKRFSTYEAEVIGVEELMHNANEAKENALGNTERSSSKAGLVPAGTLGALVCRRPDGVQFNIGTGFTAEQRQRIWDTYIADRKAGLKQQGPVGMLVTYRCFDYGRKDAPRFPVFVSFRHKDDC